MRSGRGAFFSDCIGFGDGHDIKTDHGTLYAVEYFASWTSVLFGIVVRSFLMRRTFWFVYGTATSCLDDTSAQYAIAIGASLPDVETLL